MKTLRVITALALVLGACGGDGGIDVEDAWARTSPMVTSAGAVYMNLTSSEDDSLTGASVDSSIASAVELHETVMTDMGDGEGTDDTGEDQEMDDMDGMEGAMTMRPVSTIELASGETVALEPGGYHIMLLELSEPLEAGQTFDLTLQFTNAGAQVVQIEVRDEAP